MKKIFAFIAILASAALAVQNMMVAPASLDASGEKLDVVSRGFNTATFQLTGTWSATVTFEGTVGGGTFVAIPAVNKATGVSATTTTANGIYDLSCHGLLSVRARVSAYTSGTVVVTAMALEGVGQSWAGVVSGSSSQYAEDAAHASGDQLTMAGVVRRDAPASSSGTDGDNSTLNADALGRLWTNAGQAAHNAAIASNPVRTGGRAATADFTAVSDGFQVDDLSTITGKKVVMPYALRANKWKYAAAAAGLTSTTRVKVKDGASGIRPCITSIQMMNSHQTTSTEVVVYATPGGSAATDTLWRGWAQAAGGGASVPMPVDLCAPALGDSIAVAEKTTTGTAGVLMNLQGYTTTE